MIAMTEAKPTEIKWQKQLRAGLYLVATPIGHADDISLRALAVLRYADIIFCEDTRVSQKLLALHGLPKKKLASLHAHNEAAMKEKILAAVQEGNIVALVSDAGLPLISDPGASLVEAAHEHNRHVTSIPGANAALTALQLSGLAIQPFTFLGFLPPKEKARRDALAVWRGVPTSLIVYEAPHRLCESLKSMQAVYGPRRAAVARELTKKHEEIKRGTLETLYTHYEAGPVRGECVIVVAPPDDQARSADDHNLETLLKAARKTMSPRDAAFHVASQTGLKRRAVYQVLLDMEEKA